MKRRTFLTSMGAVSVPAAGRAAESAAPDPLPPKWPGATYRRYSVDIHIPDWHPDLLGRFDAREFVGNIARARMQSFLMYTNSHAGLCLWRTKAGRMHANMGGRDFFGEVVAECRRQGIHPLAYFSLIHDNWAFQNHPEWRITAADGQDRRLKGRYGVVCPNSGYREYVLACVREIAGLYDIDGMFFDMTFWPEVCYCASCTARFWKEHDAEPPRIVDWDEPVWRTFQQARQRWLLEFAHTVTSAVKQTRPITVNHQYSTVFHNWTLGTPLELAGACDYVGGDFYGGPIQHSLACKLYHGITPHQPFEFHTSRTRTFTDHVTVKPMEELRTEAFVATLHSAALMLVDYINADGTLNSQVYEFLGRLSGQRAAYEPFLGGELLADVGVYYDKESMYNPAEKGVPVTSLQAADRCPHRDAVVGAARILQEAHIPFGLITNANLEQLARYRAVVVPAVLEMTAAQAGRFRRFVEQGGVLYASGSTSLDRFASAGPRYLLEDVLGVRYRCVEGTRITYLTPQDPGLRQAIWPQDHLSFPGPMVKAEVLTGARKLATVTLPFVEPETGRVIGSRFAAIHSNPPALTPGADPAVVLHRYGGGSSVWLAAPVEATQEAVNANLFLHLLRLVLPGPYWIEADAHPAVEVVLFNQPQRRGLLAGLLNLQTKYPAVPVPATVRVKLPEGQSAKRVLLLPDRKPVDFERRGARIQFRLEGVDSLTMLFIEI